MVENPLRSSDGLETLMISCLYYKNKCLHIEDIDLRSVAETFGTPCYVYSQQQIVTNWQTLESVFSFLPHQFFYAVKANSNLSILKLLAKMQAGFDIVSGGELERVLMSGGDPQKIVFSGVAKTNAEIEKAIQKNIYCFNVESEAELERIETIAKQLNTQVNIAFRVNPNIDPYTHHYISTGLKENKFGIDIDAILPLCKNMQQFPHLSLIGIACHIGSQLTQLKPIIAAFDRMVSLYKSISELNIQLRHINMGGGLGIHYHEEKLFALEDYATAFIKKLQPLPLTLFLEPGRFIVGNAGVLLTRVEYIKQTPHKNFVLVDAGMNDLLRPLLYDAYHHILPIKESSDAKNNYDIAGPLCESADFLGKNRDLNVASGDLLAIDTVGAYGFSMSSNYNSRVRSAEVLIHGNQMQLIRKRETFNDLIALENIN